MTPARRILAAAILAAAVLAVWGRTLGSDYGFAFDDWKVVVENPAVQQHDATGIFRAAFERVPLIDRPGWVDPGYRPVRTLSYAVDHALFGMEPRAFRATNIAIHVLNALLVFSIAAALIPGARLGAPLAAALLFALHPLATEAVTYIAGRRDVLFTLFYLAGVRLFLAHRARPAAWKAAAIVTLYLGGLGSKETAITLPLALLGIDLALGGAKDVRARAPLYAVLFAIALAVGIFTALLKNPGSVAGEAVERLGGSFANTVFTMARVVWHYAGLVVFPRTLAADYSFDAFPASRGLLDPPTAALGLLALAAAAAAIAVVWRRGARREALLAALFFVALAPVSQVVVPHPEPIAERHLYLAMIFPITLAVDLARRVPVPRGALAAAVALLAVAAGARTAIRNQDWRSDETIFRAAVEAYPRCARANLALALEYTKKAPPRWRDALDPLDRAIEVLTDAGAEGWETRRGGVLVEALFERARARIELGLHDAALADLDRVLAQRLPGGGTVLDAPQYAHVRLNRAAARKGKGDLAGAKAEYEAVLEATAALDPGDRARATLEALRTEALVQVGAIELESGAREAAFARLREAAGERPTAERARAWEVLGQAEMAVGDHAAAERTFARLAEAKLPDPSDAGGSNPSARKKNAWYLYLLAEARSGRADMDGAKEALRRALALDPRFATAAFTLADLCVKTGDLDEAERWARAAVEAAPGERRVLMLLADIGLRRAAPTSEGGAERPRPEPDPKERAADLIATAERAWRDARPKGAILALEKALELDPSRADAWERLGRAHLDLGEPERALAPLRQAVKADPERLGAEEALARAEIEAGEVARAVETADRAERRGRGAAGAGRRLALLASALEAAHDPRAASVRANAEMVAEVHAMQREGAAAEAAARFDLAGAARLLAAAREAREEARLRIAPRRAP